MRKRMTAARAAELCARLLKGHALSRIHREMGIAMPTSRCARGILKDWGVEVPPLDVRPQPTPAQQARLEALFLDNSLSGREIARLEGLSQATVCIRRRRFEAERAARGIDPPLCACGRPLHHPRLCWVRNREWMRPGIGPLGSKTPAERETARQMLVEGATYPEVAHVIGVHRTVIKQFCHRLSPDDQEVRRRRRLSKSSVKRAAIARRRVKKPTSIRPEADPRYAEIMALIPRGIEQALREDIASEVYLSVLDGRVKPSDIPRSVKRAIGSNFDRFANRWGDLSLDAPLSSDSNFCLGDILEDPRALERMETAFT